MKIDQLTGFDWPFSERGTQRSAKFNLLIHVSFFILQLKIKIETLLHFSDAQCSVILFSPRTFSLQRAIFERNACQIAP